MGAEQAIHELLRQLSEDRLNEVLEFIEFLHWQQERQQWQRHGREQFAQAYGPEEPEYTEADLKPELNL